jgi:hypothetical protein
MMIVSCVLLVTLFPSGAAAQDTTLLKDDRSPANGIGLAFLLEWLMGSLLRPNR